jgi:DNA-binding beta-propeller fold protein YncE
VSLRFRSACLFVVLACLLVACGYSSSPAQGPGKPAATTSRSSAGTTPPFPTVAPVPWQFRDPLPGMPPVVGGDIYSQTRRGMLSPVLANQRPLLFVPDSRGSSVTVIDQRTRKIVKVIPSGYLSQHVVPSYDLSKLIVNASASNELVELNPRTLRHTRTIGVPRPYNLYFTPDGKSALVMVEQHDLVRFSDPVTFKARAEVSPRGCQGPNHADFSANGRFFVVTCEFSGELVKIGTLSHRVLGTLTLDPRPAGHAATGMGMGMSMPQDVRLSPDGRTFYVADMGTNELRLISARTFRQEGVIALPDHPHGIYPSRNGRLFYISDRGAGKISVLDTVTNKIVDTWTIPGGGSPDMGGVSADGSMLWLSGRYDGVVYGFDTRRGKLVARIQVGGSPHGMAVWPQPGRYSLGHTGNMR